MVLIAPVVNPFVVRALGAGTLDIMYFLLGTYAVVTARPDCTALVTYGFVVISIASRHFVCI